jgi:hypothetical protein
MLGFAPKLPVSDDERLWVDEAFGRLEKMLGRARMLDARVVLPDAEHFPDPYDGTPATAGKLFERMCEYLRVDRARAELEIFPDETDELRAILPYWSGGSPGCAGLYIHDTTEAVNRKRGAEDMRRMLVALRSTLLKDPVPLVATIAHELGHVILIGGGLLDPAAAADHESITDLLTVFLGFGIFNANSAARFGQFQDAGRQGWSMSRLGYLPQTVYGYALAKFATRRGEHKPAWARHLTTNVRAYFKSSHAWLARNAARR